MNIVTKLIGKVKQDTVETIKEDVSTHFEENKNTYKIAGATMVAGVVLGAVIFRRPQVIQHFHIVAGS